MPAPYPAPIYSHKNETGTTTGLVIDTGTADITCFQPVMHIVITDTANVIVEGAHSPDGASGWIDYSAGGFTATASKRLIAGVQFWRSRITANTGSVTTAVGQVGTSKGGTRAMNNVIVTNNPTTFPGV